MKVKVYVILNKESGKLYHESYNEASDYFDTEFMKSELDECHGEIVEETTVDESEATDTILRNMYHATLGKYMVLICQNCHQYYGKIAGTVNSQHYLCDRCEAESFGN